MEEVKKTNLSKHIHIKKGGRWEKIKEKRERDRKLYKKLIKKIYDGYTKDFEEIVEIIIKLPKNHPVQRHIKKHKIKREELEFEIKAEFASFGGAGDDKIKENKIKSLYERQKRITDWKKNDLLLTKDVAEIRVEMKKVADGHLKAPYLKILQNFEVESLLKILKKNIIMSYYEQIRKEENNKEEVGDNNYIILTSCAIKIGEEILSWFLFRVRNKIKKKGIRINLNNVPEKIEMENKWREKGEEIRPLLFNREMIKDWSKERGEHLSVQYRIGVFLLEFIGQYTKLYKIVNYINNNRRISGILKNREKVIFLLEEETLTMDYVQPTLIGMAIPPIDWRKDSKIGGYLINNLGSVINHNFTKENIGFREEYKRESGETYKNNIPNSYYKAINRMQRVPFKINEEVYSIIRESFNNDPQNAIWELKFKRNVEEDLEIMKKLTNNGKKQYFLINMILNEAEQYIREYPQGKFYIPQVVEKRGRAYALTSIINFYNSGLVRSLMSFYNGEEIESEKNMGELIALGSGLYDKSYEKAGREEKIKWLEENKEQFFFYSVEENKFKIIENSWKEAKNSPFEFLSWLLEMRNLYNVPETERNRYKTHFPIGKDCTSSAFQIYSLLLNDRDIARASNLINFDEGGEDHPNDIYMNFRDVFYQQSKEYIKWAIDNEEKEIKKREKLLSKKKNERYALEILRRKEKREILLKISGEEAGILNKLINRKFCKGVLMTSGYGVTREGLSKQIYQYIIREIIEYPFPEKKVYKKMTPLERENYAHYKYLKEEIINIFIQIIKETMELEYNGLERFMNLMRRIAREVTKRKLPFVVNIPSKEEGESFIFLQLYQKLRAEKVGLRLRNLTFLKRTEGILRISNKDENIIPDTIANRRGAPPNCIHCFDAKILMQIINQIIVLEKRLNIKKKGINIRNFTSVHDKFITTAANIRWIPHLVRKSYFQLSETLKNWVEDILITQNLENLRKVIKKEEEFNKIKGEIIREWKEIKENSHNKGGINNSEILKSKYLVY